jgi:hypothetical protein
MAAARVFATLALMGCGSSSHGDSLPTKSDRCLADAQAGKRPIAVPSKPLHRPGDPTPLEVPSSAVDGKRISGETMIEPDTQTQFEMQAVGVDQTSAAFQLCLDTTGTPIAVERLSSTCFPRFDERLRTTIFTWRYSPYSLDGAPKTVCTRLNYVYVRPRPRRAVD